MWNDKCVVWREEAEINREEIEGKRGERGEKLVDNQSLDDMIKASKIMGQHW